VHDQHTEHQKREAAATTTNIGMSQQVLQENYYIFHTAGSSRNEKNTYFSYLLNEKMEFIPCSETN